MIDIAIVGAGPAGLAAGIYAARAGYSTVLFEGMVVGGQLNSIDKLENYPGFADGVGGFDIAFAMRNQAERFGATIVSERIEHLEVVEASAETPRHFKLTSSMDKETEARSVVLAMGAQPTPLPIEGIDQLVGRGVSYCATCDGNFFRDKVTMVVGGGDTACADAMYLSRICPLVHVVHRRDTLRANAWYAHQLEALDNVVMHWNSVVEKVETEAGVVDGALLKNVKTGEMEDVSTSAVFVAIGTTPDTAWLKNAQGAKINLDAAGYAVADETGQTPCPGVFVAGDARTTPLRQVVTAVSDGALAAEQAAKYLATC